MNYNNLRIVGKSFSPFFLRRHLHDRKLPGITNHYRNNRIVRWVGVESPKKADFDNHVIKTHQWTSKDIECKEEYDEEYLKEESPIWRED